MVVKLPGIPKRPGPMEFYAPPSQGYGKTWIMLQHAAAMEQVGFKTLFISLDPKRKY